MSFMHQHTSSVSYVHCIVWSIWKHVLHVVGDNYEMVSFQHRAQYNIIIVQ